VLYEDGKTNRLHESLNLFGEIINSRWFKRIPIILFLNKIDLFKEKIKTVDMKCCFTDYDGGCNYNAATKFLVREFQNRNERPSKPVFAHFTCAMDRASVTVTFKEVREIVITAALKASAVGLS